MDLVEFLRARLARDEQIAQMCAGAPWKAAPSGTVNTDTSGGEDEARAEPAFVATAENGAYAEHIARHDPSRTLRQVAAARQIIDDYEKESWILAQGAQSGHGNQAPGVEAAHAARESVLRLLALPYAAHPAYQEEWRP